MSIVMIFFRLQLLALSLLLFVSSLHAQDSSEPDTGSQLSAVVAEQRTPAWLLVKEGERLYHEGDYGEALRKLLTARSSSFYTPEADYLIGRILDVDSNLSLAVSWLKKALDQKDFFYDLNDIYKIYMTLAKLYFRQQEYYQYEVTMLKVISMELPATSETLRRGRQMSSMLQNQGMDAVLYYYDESYSNIVPALNDLSLYYYKKAYYNDALRLSLRSVISTISQGIDYLKKQQYITRIPQSAKELYAINPEYIINKISADLLSVGIDYQLRWNFDDLTLQDPDTQLAEIIAKIQEVDSLYSFTLLGYYLNIFEQYPLTLELTLRNHLYRQLYFIGSALSIEGRMDSSNHILNVLRYMPQAGEWSVRARSQLRQSFIDKQVPLGPDLPD